MPEPDAVLLRPLRGPTDDNGSGGIASLNPRLIYGNPSGCAKLVWAPGEEAMDPLVHEWKFGNEEKAWVMAGDGE